MRLQRVGVASLAVVLAGVVSGSAFASPPRNAGQVHGTRGGGIFAGGQFGFGGNGRGGPGAFQGLGQGGGPGQGGHGGGQGALVGADLLTPAATFLGVSVTTLESDLAGGKSLAQEAVAKGKTASALVTALVASEQSVLDAQKAAGWLTAAQETSVLADLTDQITDLVNNGPAVPASSSKPQSLFQLAATFLGITTSDLQTDLKAGKSLADEATAKGKSVSDLVTALEAPAKSKLDAQVTAGTITQAQETAILARATTQLTTFVNGSGSSSQSSATTNTLKKLVLHSWLKQATRK
jgi:hypothetical protein